MFHDLGEVRGREARHYDVCIVGSGPAGLALATRLNHGRARICILESGGRSVEDRFQKLNESECVGIHYDYLGSRCRAFGGTSQWWTGACTLLDPVDFTDRSWVPEARWPFDRQELLRFYPSALRFLGIDRFDLYDPGRLPSRWWEDPEGVDFDLAGLEPKVFQYSTPPTNLGTALSELVGTSDDVDCYLDATVIEIATNRDGTVADHVVARSLDGNELRVGAKMFVVCAGGLESARILLLSDSVRAGGLGNEHDQVGRNLMEHLRLQTNWLPFARRTHGSFYADVPVPRGLVKVGFTVQPALQSKKRILNPNLMLIWNTLGEDEADVWEAVHRVKALGWPSEGPQAPLAPLIRKPHVVARLAWEKLRKRPGFRQLALCANHEQSLNPSSRVMLSDETDSLGLRKLKIDWRLQEVDRHSIAEFQRVVREAFARTGLSESIEFHGPDEHRPFDDSSHAMGTTLMSDDPRKGVVDANCRVHSVSNLYVCGSAVFPRGGNANPTLTIVALAMRLAEHLGGRIG